MSVILGGSTTITYERTEYNHPVEPVVVQIEVKKEEPDIETLIRETFPEDSSTAIAIAKCESGLNPKAYNGNNRNGTVDRGLFQLNSIHDSRIKELGLNVWDVRDNLTFARILYEERGWKPWVCSRHVAHR